MGAGEDRIVIGLGTGDLEIVLGRGVDTIDFAAFPGIPDSSTAPHATDFDTGNNGDRIDLRALLIAVAPDYRAGANPFAGGYARLVTNGTATEVRIDRDAGGTAFAFQTVLVIDDAAPADFTAFNFGGFAPVTWAVDQAIAVVSDHRPVLHDAILF